jgi:hypothetical protein
MSEMLVVEIPSDTRRRLQSCPSDRMTGCAISGVRFRHALQAENHILACTKPETRLGLVVSNCAQSETLDSRVPFHVP